jgi:hypothetical protein
MVNGKRVRILVVQPTFVQDDEMHHFDKCCLHLAVKMKDKTETVIFKVC